jgi:hypothetical protein
MTLYRKKLKFWCVNFSFLFIIVNWRDFAVSTLNITN